MFHSGGRERFECSLHDSLTTDVDPGAGGHLAIHGQTESFEAVELGVIVPLPDEVRIRNQNTRCFIVGPKLSDRFARLHKQRLVVLEMAQRINNRVERLPPARGPPRSTINYEAIRSFGHIGIEIVHDHSHGRFLMPALASALCPPRCVNGSSLGHNLSKLLSKSPCRIAWATFAISPESERSPASGGAIFRTAAKARSTPIPALSGRRCSRASEPASSSIANKFSARSTIDRSFSAAVMPIETWSSFPPEVVMLSTLAG